MSIYEKFNSEYELKDFSVEKGNALCFPSLNKSGEPVFGFKLSNNRFYYIKSGTSFKPHVDNEGNLSWSNEDGKDNPPTVNIMGEAAGFGTPTVSTKTLEPDKGATVVVTASGEDTSKIFNFDFGIPKGDTGVAAGFGEPTATVKTLASHENATIKVTASGEDTNKVFNFEFGIPRGQEGTSAGFGVPIASAKTLEPDKEATVNVTASGKDTNKVFSFAFGIPKGKTGEPGSMGAPAGFGKPTSTVETLEPDKEATIKVTASGYDVAKVFNFDFGIPRGVPAGFGEPTATIKMLESDEQATVKVTASGEDTSKIFNFDFGIPKPKNGSDYCPFKISTNGDSVSINHGAREEAEYCGVANVNGELMRVPCLLGNYGTGFVILTATIKDSYDEIEFSVSVNQSLPKNPATKSGFTVLGEIISENNIIQYVNTVPVIIIGEECG